MKYTFKNNKLKKSLTLDKEIFKSYGDIARKVKQRISEIGSFETLADLATLPALRVHPLSGDKKDLWSVTIVKNWRIIFEIDQDPVPILEDGGIDKAQVTSIKILSIQDYH